MTEDEFWQSYNESIKDCVKPVLRVWEVDIGYSRDGLTQWYYICTIDGLHPTESRAYYYHRLQDDLTDDSELLIEDIIIHEVDEDWQEGDDDLDGYLNNCLKELKEGYYYEFKDFAISQTKQTYPEEQYRLFWDLDYAPIKLGYDGPPPGKTLFGA
ncbi:hypothetical protein [Pontibacter pudoricolor]|uniref:hypothetical protein n=1 Tax=Pontibacter pudoricolor TaxID=2694930 RepID=UPI001391CA49|nr:hypothetical protein [Pontibacter pudoricolor]